MQRQFVPLDAKAVRQGGSVWNRDRADIQVVDGFAASAAEMAVMIEVGVLVPRAPFGEGERPYLPGLQQQFDRPINSGSTHRGASAFGPRMNLLDRERSRRRLDYLKYHGPLSGATLANPAVNHAGLPAGPEDIQATRPMPCYRY